MSRLETLMFTRRVVEQQALQQLAQIDAWIQGEVHREQAHQRAAERRPPPADWLLEKSVGGKPTAVHTGECFGSNPNGARVSAITREQALRALTEGLTACTLCRPDTELGLP